MTIEAQQANPSPAYPSSWPGEPDFGSSLCIAIGGRPPCAVHEPNRSNQSVRTEQTEPMYRTVE